MRRTSRGMATMSNYVMTGKELADKATDIARNYKTLYVWGGFGAPLNKANKERYTGPNAAAYNRKPARTELILEADSDTFAFDCVGLIKGLLWASVSSPLK